MEIIVKVRISVKLCCGSHNKRSVLTVSVCVPLNTPKKEKVSQLKGVNIRNVRCCCWHKFLGGKRWGVLELSVSDVQKSYT